jgi:hypothetical protein
MAVIVGESPFCLVCGDDEPSGSEGAREQHARDCPGKVTPIARFHTCASCHLEIEHSARFTLDAHGEECMQPEIRMRRAESRILELINAVNTQTEQVDALVMRVSALVQEHWGVNL